jgi:hypothetical protein
VRLRRGSGLLVDKRQAMITTRMIRRRKSNWMRVYSATVAVFALSCGSNSPIAPQRLDLGGTWSGRLVITGVAGGECASMGQDIVGASDVFRLQLIQDGTSITSVGGDCVDVGQTDGTTLTLNLVSGSCLNRRNGVLCGSLIRDWQTVSNRIVGTVTGSEMRGTETETTNLYVPGTETIAEVMVTTSSFSASR